MSAGADKMEDLLVTCLELHENGEPDSLEAFLRENPEHEPRLRRYLQFLGAMNATPESNPKSVSDLPRQMGEFRLLESIGRGAMGEVWLAEQTSLKRRCALKIVRFDGKSMSAIERFRREAKALARVESDHVVRVIASGESGNLGYLAMDFVDGLGLDEILEQDDGLVLADYVRLTRDIAHALHAVHLAGLIHRDVKPSNIRITPEGKAILIDFGLARDLLPESLALSASGSFVGTPYYAAPEQLVGDDTDLGPATDVYSLGVCLYECVTKQRPFLGTQPAEVFRQILTAEPEPAHNLAPSISPPLARVIAMAMEKDQQRRYKSALEFAQDLDAVLELRPVIARADSRLRQLIKWSRRHRAAAFILITLLLATLTILGTIAIQDLRERDAQSYAARDAVASALVKLEEYKNGQHNTEELMQRRSEILYLLPFRHLSAAESQELDSIERSLKGSEGDREEQFFEMLELLRRAERLDATIPGIEETRAQVYLEKWKLARASRDPSLTRFYRNRVLEADKSGTFDSTVRGGTSLMVKTTPADAEVHLFELRSQSDLQEDGQFRLVPIPHRWTNDEGLFVGTPSRPLINPGEFCLRIVRGTKDLPADTLITHIAGRAVAEIEMSKWATIALEGRQARVVIDGRIKDCTLPQGLFVRPTTRPLLFGPDSLVEDPGSAMKCLAGSWLLLIRKAGYISRRVHFTLGPGSTAIEEFSIGLDPIATVPPEFVCLHDQADSNDERRIWMMDREVTCAEYLEFLNSAESQAMINHSPVPILYPRIEANAAHGGYWKRRADGRFELNAKWQPDMPVIGVSFDDANAYADWKSKQFQQSGFKLKLALPLQSNYQSFSRGQEFVWGDRFRPHWTNSCHSTSRPAVEPVMSYPIDESIGGIFDIAGSAQEWCSHWFSEAQNERILYGGSWAHAQPIRFGIKFVSGAKPDRTGDTFGFRLIAKPMP